jgi:uncharacterized protein (DUF2267 family)
MTVFGKAIERANTWVKGMMAELPTQDPQVGLHALRAGLHALRDRLTVEETAQLSAQLPTVIRGLFFENWRPSGKPLRIRHKDEFLALVAQNFSPRTDVPPDEIVRALFRLMAKHVSPGEIADVVMTLPEPLVELVRSAPEAQP